MNNLRAYQLALNFHLASKNVSLNSVLKDQFTRASVSIVLNLAEGSGKRTLRDQKRFYQIAFGSIRECQALIDLSKESFTTDMIEKLDHTAAATYKLLKYQP